MDQEVSTLITGVWRHHPARFIPNFRDELLLLRMRDLATAVEIRTSSIPEAGGGVFATKTLPKGFSLPYLGVVYPTDDESVPLFDRTYAMEDGDCGVIDGDPTKMPSLFRYASMINEPACEEGKRVTRMRQRAARKQRGNCEIDFDDPIWNDVTPTVIRTTQAVVPGQELLMDYGEQYDREYESKV